jgi:site-specific recombinase XerD
MIFKISFTLIMLININNTAISCLQATIKKIEGAYAPNTIRAYKSNFEFFINFCDENNKTAFPTIPETVVRYIKHISSGRLKSSSIKIAVASISAIHRFNSEIDPAQHTDVKIEMRRMYRTLGRFTKQAYGINKDLLEKMIDTTDDSLRGVRNRAILLVAYDTLCRRSELVNLSIEDLKITQSNNERKIELTLRKSKTDPEGFGRPLYLSKKAQKAIFEWIQKANIKSGKLFRAIYGKHKIKENLNLGQINRIYKNYAKLINLDFRLISGHSLRIGSAQDLLVAGNNLSIIMNRGRWSKTDTVMRYVEFTKKS